MEPRTTDTRLMRIPVCNRNFHLSRRKAPIFSLKLARLIQTPFNRDNGHFTVYRVTNSHTCISSNPTLLGHCALHIFIVTIMFWILSETKQHNCLIQFKKWLTCSVQPSSYGCTREVAKLERSVRVARGDSRVQLCFLTGAFRRDKWKFRLHTGIRIKF